MMIRKNTGVVNKLDAPGAARLALKFIMKAIVEKKRKGMKCSERISCLTAYI